MRSTNSGTSIGAKFTEEPRENDVGASYVQDVVLWANEQAALLRAGRFAELDIEHFADELEDVGKAKEHELERRLRELLVEVLKWQCKPAHRCLAWTREIALLRLIAEGCFKYAPSLRVLLADPEFVNGVWSGALVDVVADTGRDDFPNDCPWPMTTLLAPDWLPL
jgi:hypothetical protein